MEYTKLAQWKPNATQIWGMCWCSKILIYHPNRGRSPIDNPKQLIIQI